MKWQLETMAEDTGQSRNCNAVDDVVRRILAKYLLLRSTSVQWDNLKLATD